MDDELTAATERVLSFLHRFEKGELTGAFDGFLQTGLDLPVVDELSLAVSASGFLLTFDWMAWKLSLQSDPFDPSRVSASDVETIRKLLTLAVRENRFRDGALAARCSDGSMERALRRLAEIT